MSAVPVPDPARRGLRRGQGATELKSPVRKPGYVPPVRSYRTVSPGHLVIEA
jgi:peptide/nickel transport system ATP-binding protein